jgi:hypothetical protein
MSEDPLKGRTGEWAHQRGETPAAAPQGERLLWVGDRMPDFVLPDPTTKLWYFYQSVTGRPTVLVLAANTARQDQWDEIKGFAEAIPAYREEGLDLVIASNDGVESLAMVCRIIPEHALWLADIKGVVNFGIRTGALFPYTGVVCALLDGNQRIVAIRGPEPGQAEWVLSCYKALPKESAMQLNAAAPVLLLPRVLEPADCQALMAQLVHADSPRGEQGVVDEKFAAQLSSVLLRRIGPEVEKVFSVDDFVLGPLELHWTSASPEARPDRLRENDDPAVKGRYFILLLDLSAGDYEGDGIRFPEYGPHDYRPGPGGAVIFAGTIIRELPPVSSGRRCLLKVLLRRTPPTAAKQETTRA